MSPLEWLKFIIEEEILGLENRILNVRSREAGMQKFKILVILKKPLVRFRTGQSKRRLTKLRADLAIIVKSMDVSR